jgi:hypothetical protein
MDFLKNTFFISMLAIVATASINNSFANGDYQEYYEQEHTDSDGNTRIFQIPVDPSDEYQSVIDMTPDDPEDQSNSSN